MCLLLSRIPILKDMRLAVLGSEEGQKLAAAGASSHAGAAGAGGGEGRERGADGVDSGRKDDEESIITYDDREDDFSFAGVYA